MVPTHAVMGLLDMHGALTRERVLGLMCYHVSLPPGHIIIAAGSCDFVLLLEFAVYGVIACLQHNRRWLFLILLASWREGGSWA